ncbi:MAG: phosphatidylglycerophosphatase, partial [Actinomycetota bacterium]|nr:phosphatidylglycerophosphatase [Actinomycetota bacterium]
MTGPRRTFAAFDFDGTLTRRDTLVPFLTTVAGRAVVMRALAAESGGLARAAAGRADRDVAKERVLTRVLAGRPHSEVATAG